MKNSKIAAVALVAAMALSMTACGAKTEETVAETSAEETVVETTVEETVAETTAAETVAETVAETEAEETAATEPSIDEDLVGTWSAEIEGASIVYIFNDDATGSMVMTEEGEEIEIPFTYNVPEQGTITLTIEMFGETNSTDGSYAVDGDTLTIDDGTDSVDFTRE